MITVEEAIKSLYSRVQGVYAQQPSYTCVRTFTPDPILNARNTVFIPDPDPPKKVDNFTK